MRSLTRALLPVAVFGAFALACSGEDGEDAGPRDAGFEDAGADAGDTPRDAGEAPQDAGTVDAGAGDGNDGFEEAASVTRDARFGAPGAIQAPGDRDYFAFEGTAGEFIIALTESRGAAGDRVDTVIRLYDSSFEQVAENDDAVPRVDVDSEIVYRLPADGRYYVEVLEWSDWAGEDPEGRPGFDYRIFVRTIDSEVDGVVVETESGNDAASAIDAELSPSGLYVGGFEDADDVDVLRFDLTEKAPNERLYVQAMPPGPDGHGATTPVGSVWLTDATGADVVARLDLSAEQLVFSPGLPAGEYLLWISHPGGDVGSNDFWALKAFLFTENQPEVEPNDSIAQAERRPLAVRETQMDRASFLLAMLPDGDEDFFAIEPMVGEVITVVCGSRTAGSGVEGLTIELQEADGTVVGTATEPADDLARLEDQTVTSTVVYVRLSKTGQSPDVSGAFVRCGLFAQPE